MRTAEKQGSHHRQQGSQQTAAEAHNRETSEAHTRAKAPFTVLLEFCKKRCQVPLEGPDPFLCELASERHRGLPKSSAPKQILRSQKDSRAQQSTSAKNI